MYSCSMHPMEDLANDFRKLGSGLPTQYRCTLRHVARFVFWGSELPFLQRLIVELLLKKSNNCAISN